MDVLRLRPSEVNMRSENGGSSTPRRRRLLLWLALAVTAVPFVQAAPVRAATAISITGTVQCAAGHAVQGVWLESTGGGSTWAEWQAMPGKPAVARIWKSITTSVPTSIRLHVGCGKNSDGSWWSNNRTGYLSTRTSRVLNTTCVEAAGTGTRCGWPKMGSARDYNGFDWGYCTWGAAEKFKATFGKYPDWAGNAYEWATAARNAGWGVRSIPAPRSIVVMPSGVGTSSSLGHVGYVNSIRYTSSGVTLNITDMNHTGLGQWSTRDVTHQSGFQYILIP